MKKKIIIIIATFIISVVLICGFLSLNVFDTSAKYTNYKEMNHYYESNKLYISSPTLAEGNEKYNIINYYNYETINIELNNSISENQITNYDIEYKVTCDIIGDAKNYYDCTFENNKNEISNILKKQGTCIEKESLSYKGCIEKKYNYKLEIKNQNHEFKINKIKDNNYQKIELVINLITTSPFSKTLKATYIINIGDNNKNKIYIDNIKNFDTFCEYTINNNYEADKNIKISFDTSQMLYDINDNNVIYTENEENIIDSITIKLNKLSTKKIRLYKKDFNLECKSNDINYEIIE